MLVIDGVQIVLNGAYERGLREEIIDKCMFLLTLIRGTVPFNREIGMDPDIVSQPSHIARQKYTLSAIEVIEQFETRAVVEEVLFVASGGGDAGNMIPRVVLTYNGE